MKHKRQVLTKPEDSEKKSSGDLKRRSVEDSTNNNHSKSTPSSPDSMCSSDVKKEESNDSMNTGSSITPGILTNGAILPLSGPGSLGVPGVLGTPPCSLPNTTIESIKVKAEEGNIRLSQMSGSFTLETGSLKENLSPRNSPLPPPPPTSSPIAPSSASTSPTSIRAEQRTPGPPQTTVSNNPCFVSNSGQNLSNRTNVGRSVNFTASYTAVDAHLSSGRNYTNNPNYRNSWGANEKSWPSRNTPVQYMNSSASPRIGTPHSYEYPTVQQQHQQQHHQQQQHQQQQQQRGTNNQQTTQQQQQQMYNNNCYSMETYNYNRQYYNNNMMCTDSYNYSYNNGMYCGNMYNNCVEAQQYYDQQQQQYALSQGFDPEKAAMVTGPPLTPNGAIPVQNVVPPGMNAYYGCPSGNNTSHCTPEGVPYQEYPGNIPGQHETDINFTTFNFFEQGGGGAGSGGNNGPGGGGGGTIGNVPPISGGGDSSDATASVTGGVIVGPATADGLIPNQPAVGTMPSLRNGGANVPGGMTGAGVTGVALPPLTTTSTSGGSTAVVMSGSGGGSSGGSAGTPNNLPSDNSNSSDFNFLSNLANDFAPEYYQLS